MGGFKKLAGETAIYGMSTIIARMINFFLVPVYTVVLSRGQYGAYSEIMSYIAVLQVVLVLGLETGCFRFANKDGVNPSKVFSSALGTVFTLCLVFFIFVALYSGRIAALMGYEGYGKMILYAGGILFLDSVTAILFAKLRYMYKAVKFAVFKTIKILSEFGFNLLFLYMLPSYFKGHPHSFLLNFIPAQVDFSYIIFAVFLSCIVCTVLLLPDFFKVGMKIEGKLTKKLLAYSVPLMIASFPGILNESIDKILFRFFAPGADWRSDLGVYQAAVKLAVIMNLFIQMFRYAAEPFFFARQKDKNSRVLYARVMEYFVAFCMLIFVGVLLYMDLIGLLIGKDFRGAFGTIPLKLFSYMLLGILFNVSMWYKIGGYTKYAINITLLGLVVNAVVNILFLPLISYWASAFGHVVSCSAMLLYSLHLGNKYYPIPYDWKRISRYIFAGIIIFLIFRFADYLLGKADIFGNTALLVWRMALGTIGIAIYCIYALKKTGMWADIIKRLSKNKK